MSHNIIFMSHYKSVLIAISVKSLTFERYSNFPGDLTVDQEIRGK